jgi:hypothetical protein
VRGKNASLHEMLPAVAARKVPVLLWVGGTSLLVSGEVITSNHLGAVLAFFHPKGKGKYQSPFAQRLSSWHTYRRGFLAVF